MNEKEIRAMFQPNVCNSQIEFDDFMHSVNNAQSIANHPHLDRLRELNKQQALIETQKQSLNVQLNAIKVERLEIEQKQKDINRVFHAIKHELIELNPKGLKNETADS
jgi:hypothetical protein